MFFNFSYIFLSQFITLFLITFLVKMSYINQTKTNKTTRTNETNININRKQFKTVKLYKIPSNKKFNIYKLENSNPTTIYLKEVK